MQASSMTCSEIVERLPLFAGEDLDSETLDAVREHLEGCPPCALRAREAGEARAALVRSLDQGVGRLGAGLWPAVAARLGEEAHAPAPRVLRGPRVARWFAAAAAAVLLGTIWVVDPAGPGAPASLPGMEPESGGGGTVPGADSLAEASDPESRLRAGQPLGGLRQVGWDEPRLHESAPPLQVVPVTGVPGQVRPRPSGENALTGYR